MGVFGVIWLTGGLITIVLAWYHRLPLVMWIIAGLLMGPLGLLPMGHAVANKRRLPTYDDGSSRYGGGADLGS